MHFGYTFRATLMVVGALATFIVAACSNESPEEEDPNAVAPVTRTERLEIVSSTGDTRAVVTTLEDGRPSLTMIDDQGQDRAWLFLSADGSPNLILIDGSRFVLMDGAGEIRSALRLDAAGAPVFSSLDQDGRLRSLMRLAGDGSPINELYDADGTVIWAAP